MKLASSILGTFTALLLLVLLAGPAAAQTHMGQNWKEHVNIQFFAGGGKTGVCPVGDGNGTLAMYRIHADGTTSKFSLPEGKVLVVTDFNVGAYNGGAGALRESLRLDLKAYRAGAKGGTIVYQSSFHLTSDLDSNIYALTGQSLSGIYLSGGATLCPAVQIDDGSQPTPLVITAGNYRGYLIDE